MKLKVQVLSGGSKITDFPRITCAIGSSFKMIFDDFLAKFTTLKGVRKISYEIISKKMRNKPNSPNVQIYLTSFLTMNYAIFTSLTKVKNKPKTNPIWIYNNIKGLTAANNIISPRYEVRKQPSSLITHVWHNIKGLFFVRFLNDLCPPRIKHSWSLTGLLSQLLSISTSRWNGKIKLRKAED